MIAFTSLGLKGEISNKNLAFALSALNFLWYGLLSLGSSFFKFIMIYLTLLPRLLKLSCTEFSKEQNTLHVTTPLGRGVTPLQEP